MCLCGLFQYTRRILNVTTSQERHLNFQDNNQDIGHNKCDTCDSHKQFTFSMFRFIIRPGFRFGDSQLSSQVLKVFLEPSVIHHNSSKTSIL
jgi:hypothetical protein